MSNLPETIGQLKESGWKSISVKDEMRKNLVNKIKKREELFPGILGYENTVIPQIVNAILARHDIILLGLRGQAKTKMLRMLTQFLDEQLPVIKGSEIMDDPFHPISRYAKKTIEEKGDETAVEWIGRELRYGEKLATPDTTVGDLIGDLDPIKAASKRMALANEEVINFGLIPRVNRGIFVINELPDLQPRIQVALLNILQERDIQIRGFNVRIPLDVSMAFSANPEDYTNRGNIITPLKDRIDSQIITHYPKILQTAMTITRQEAWSDRKNGLDLQVPELFREIIETVAFEARESEYVDQKSGVSTRMTITALEQVLSAMERRAIQNDESSATTRIADLYHMVPALTGKLELVYEGEQEGAANVAKHLIGKSINKVFKLNLPDPQNRKRDEKSSEYSQILTWFSQGNDIEIEDSLSQKEYEKKLKAVDGLKKVAKKYRPDKQNLFSMMDFILEGLHQNSMLGKEDVDDKRTYSDMIGAMLGGMESFDDEDFDDI